MKKGCFEKKLKIVVINVWFFVKFMEELGFQEI
jgi:hypothetical protein